MASRTLLSQMRPARWLTHGVRPMEPLIYLPAYLNGGRGTYVGFAFHMEKCSKVCSVLTWPHTCIIWKGSLWDRRLMVLYLTCHMSDSLAKPQASSCHTRWCSWWQRVAPSSFVPSQAALRLTQSTLPQAINLPLGLPKMLSQLLVADIFQLPMWNSLRGPTAELRVCLQAVSWEWADKIALLPLCPSWLFLKGWGRMAEFIRLWM